MMELKTINELREMGVAWHHVKEIKWDLFNALNMTLERGNSLDEEIKRTTNYIKLAKSGIPVSNIFYYDGLVEEMEDFISRLHEWKTMLNA